MSITEPMVANQEPSQVYEPRNLNLLPIATKRRALKRALSKIAYAALVFLILLASASAADLRGKVINGTTRKPAAGDDVILFVSGERMNEVARSTTDSAGRFRLSVSDEASMHVLRVIHEGVTYHQVVQPGENAYAVVDVYDASPKLDGIIAVMDVERFESIGDMLEVKQLVTMRNESKPPQTLMKDRSFEVQLPADAKVQYGLTQVEDAQPLRQKPRAGNQPGHYYFNFPIRPGDTRFAVVYRIPYKGEASIQPTIQNARERFVAMLPKSMRFEATDPTVFHPMENTTADNVQGTEPVSLDQTVSFHISGSGVLAELEGRSQTAKKSKANQDAPTSKVGGGLGPPIGAPDPLQQYRWLILGGFAFVLLAGLVLVIARGQAVQRAAAVRETSLRAPARRLRRELQREGTSSRNRGGTRSKASHARAHG